MTTPILPLLAGAAAITFLSQAKKKVESWVEDRGGVLCVKSEYVLRALSGLDGFYVTYPQQTSSGVVVELATDPGEPRMGARVWADQMYANGYTVLISLYSQQLCAATPGNAAVLANIAAAKKRYDDQRILSAWAIMRSSPNQIVATTSAVGDDRAWKGSMLGYKPYSATINRLSYMMPPAARQQWLNVRRGQPCRLVNEGTVWVYQFGTGPQLGYQVIDALRSRPSSYALLANGDSLGILPASQPGESPPRMGWYGPLTQRLLESMTGAGWMMLSDPPR